MIKQSLRRYENIVKRAKSCLLSTNLFWSSPKVLITSASWNALCSPGKTWWWACSSGWPRFWEWCRNQAWGKFLKYWRWIDWSYFSTNYGKLEVSWPVPPVHNSIWGFRDIVTRYLAFLHLSFSAGSRGKRKTVALFPSSELPLLRVTQHFFPILIVLYKLRCIASNSTEALINLFLFIYLQVTCLHHCLRSNHVFSFLT